MLRYCVPSLGAGRTFLGQHYCTCMLLKSRKKEDPSCFSGKVSLMLALGGQNCWLQRFFFSAFSWTVAYQSWDCFFCAHTQYWNSSRKTHGASNMKELSIFYSETETRRTSHVFPNVIGTLLMNIWCNSTKMNDALFAENFSLFSTGYGMCQTACERKWKISWSKTLFNTQYNILGYLVFSPSVQLWIILISPYFWRKFSYDWNFCLVYEKAVLNHIFCLL